MNDTAGNPVMDALFIGFLVGIVIFSVANNSWGFAMLLPLYLIYRFLKKPKSLEGDISEESTT